ncbi:amino acid adenylation domain-containing protein [Sphingobacterium faecium]|uniref:amino acid adenylation domain-containing protein n=1 Tax=Sphingobacterium faecium TaxID=34087 RepID=UPI00320A0093
MSSIKDFIVELEKKGIVIVLDNEDLNVKIKNDNILDGTLDQIKLRKSEIIQYLRSLKPLVHNSFQNSDFFPTTSAQKQIHALCQYDSIGTTYNLHQAIQFSRKIIKRQLEACILQIVNQQEALRATFHLMNGVLMQKIQDNINFKICEENIDKSQLEKTLIEAINEFNLEEGPLFRVFLYHLSENESVVLIDIHHIVSDGISMNIIKEQLIKLLSGKESKNIKNCYKEFCVRHFSKIEAGRFAEGEDFWRNHLSGELPSLQLPYDFNEIQAENFEGNVYTFRLDAKLVKKVKLFCEVNRLSHNMFLMACYTILLSKLADSEDIIIGTVTSGRTNPLFSQTVGLFVNTSPLRSSPKSNKTLIRYFNEIKNIFLGVLEHDSFPVAEVLNEFNNYKKKQLFKTVFVYQISDSVDGMSGVGNVQNIPFSNNTSKYDITVAAFEKADELGFRIEYKTKLFRDTTIKRLGAFLSNIITTAVNEQDARIGDIKLSSVEEQNGIDVALNKIDVVYPVDETICSLFYKQVRKNPYNIAIEFNDYQITYIELERESNELANFLIARGLTRGAIVAILLGRDINAIISILAVIKAGGIYLPIDINSSQGRINYILNDSSAEFIISQSEISNKLLNSQLEILLKNTNREIICLDRFSNEIKRFTDKPVNVNVFPTDLAYIIYTSGTSGKPKGTLIEHENVVRLLFNDRFQFDFDSSDTWSLFHALNFDFSVWEMYGALLTGAKLILVPENTTKDPEAFLELIRRRNITVLNQTPQAFYSLSEKMIYFDDIKLRYIIFGGERLTPRKLKKWKQKYPETKLINMYGITETTVHVTVKEITEKEIENNECNIGEILPTLKGDIVNKENYSVPKGVVGELLIYGKGVARGYLNNPELTADRFWKNQDGEKLYRSGDLVKLNYAGDLIYIGRNDKQLKVRGYRVDPKEIEDQLLNFTSLNNAVVCLQNTNFEKKSENACEPTLCAYFTANRRISNNTLYTFLKQNLPSYCIPSYFVQLKEIPTTSNGKIDYEKLPLPTKSKDKKALEAENNFKGKIIEIFDQLTNASDFDHDDSFFSIGGDSIKVIRLSAMLGKAFSMKFTVADLYLNDSVNKILSFISNAHMNRNEEFFLEIESDLKNLKNEISLEIDSQDVADIYPMSDIETGMCYHYIRSNDRKVYHDSFGFSIKFPDFNNDIFYQACRIMFEKHDIFRSAFYLEKFRIPIKIVYNAVKTSYFYRDISNFTPRKHQAIISEAVKDDLNKPFVIEHYPLIRFFVYKLDNKSIYLFFSVHHSILDGWSINSFLVELCNLYNNLFKKKDYKLQFLKATYKDAVIYEINEKKKKTNQIFWKKYLSDHQRLILQKNKFEDSASNMLVYKRICSNLLFNQLRRFSESTGISLKNILFSAFTYAIRVLQNQKEFVLGMVTNLRPPIEDGDCILGCFLNTIPIKIDLNKPRQTWKEFLLDTNENLTEIKQYETLSLAEISKQVIDTGGDNPFFDVLFNFLDFHINDDLEIAYNDLYDHHKVQIDPYTNTNTYLDFEVNITSSELVLLPKYNRQYFEVDRISKLCEYFIRILDKMIKCTDELINNSDIISDNERLLVQKEFANGQYAESTFNNLISPFERSVIKYPNNYAVEAEGRKITYKQLNDEANNLAYFLKALGEPEDSIFGVMTERSPEMITSVISILKAGFAYLPIEPNQPSDRIAKIIANSSIRNLIVSSSLLGKVNDMIDELGSLCNIICVEDKLLDTGEVALTNKKIIFYDKVKSRSTANLNESFFKDKPAYVIYTSGTTGIPKGVIINHISVVNTLDWINKTYSISYLDKILFVNSLAFDLSVYDIFGILWAGGCIRLVTNNENESPEKLIDILLNEGITIWNSAPAALQKLSYGFESYGGTLTNAQLRLFMLSGDWIPLSLVKVIQKIFTKSKVISLGGATEASIWSNYFNITNIKDEWTSIPYGKPIQNARYYVLDEDLGLCPIGTVGDLYIGGDCLSIGYLNDPELTCQKFIPNPFSKDEIIYKTGDLARWFDDGNMEFLGRSDSQIKIRGYRVELGEIENQLNKIKEISHSIVDTYKKNGEQVLCAYYTAENTIDTAFIKNYLRKKLPDYMIPLHIIKVDSFQTTSNGKLDRKKLPKPDEIMNKEQLPILPETETERYLCDIYQDFFNIQQISITDDFFDIGGDSLKAINILSIIQRKLKVRVELRAFFEAPNIKELAVQIDNNGYLNKKTLSSDDSTIFI